jgi:predicted transcriptional regulator
MKKSSLKLHEYYTLEAELNGLTNQQSGEVISKGLLNEKLKLTTKYWISDLAKKATAEKDAVEKIKEDLIKKHGETDENNSISIPMYINIVTNEEGETVSREVNPKFVEFQNEFNTLLQEEKEIEHNVFKLEDFENVESDGNYQVFFKLIKVGE